MIITGQPLLTFHLSCYPSSLRRSSIDENARLGGGWWIRYQRKCVGGMMATVPPFRVRFPGLKQPLGLDQDNKNARKCRWLVMMVAAHNLSAVRIRKEWEVGHIHKQQQEFTNCMMSIEN